MRSVISSNLKPAENAGGVLGRGDRPSRRRPTAGAITPNQAARWLDAGRHRRRQDALRKAIRAEDTVIRCIFGLYRGRVVTEPHVMLASLILPAHCPPHQLRW